MSVSTMPMFCPNCGTVDYDCSTVSPKIVVPEYAWKVYGQHFQDDPGAKELCGVNAWPALKHFVAGQHLVLEVGSCKPWSLDGVESAAVANTILNRISGSGGWAQAIAMDEPLAGCIVGAFRANPQQLPPEKTGDIAAATARWMQTIRADHVDEIGLIEAYPYHPMDRIIGFAHDIVVTNAQPLSFIEMDFDPYAVQDQGISPQQVAADMAKLKDFCRSVDASFRAIVTASRVSDDASYQRVALQNFRTLQQYGFDAYTVQSWLRNGDNGPATIPNNNPTHIEILKAVLGQ